MAEISSATGSSSQQRVAVVTGGGSGIGRATALLFFEQGWDVVIADLNETSMRSTLEIAGPASGSNRLVAAHADVRVEEDIERMIGLAVDTFGRLDVLV